MTDRQSENLKEGNTAKKELVLELPENSVVFNLAEELLKTVEEQFKEDQKFSDQSLLSLHSMFGNVFMRAIELLDKGKFLEFQSDDKLRRIIKVKGSKSEEYTLFYHINYCPCPAFKYQVLTAAKEITCKHVLAARLAEISGKLITEIYTGKQIADILNICTTD